jgi:hypothetical protein
MTTMMMWLGVAMAQERLELQAVAHGDFDGSGVLDQAMMYTTDEGEVVVEVTLDLPERERLEPSSSSDPELVLEVDDMDGDRLDDTLIGLGEETWALISSERGWLPEGATHGAGDLEPDYTIFSINGGVDGNINTNVGPYWPLNCSNHCTNWLYELWVCGRGLCRLSMCASWKTICY